MTMKLNIVALLASTALSCLVQTTLAQDFTLKILHINDHHARLEDETFEIETADLPSEVTESINTTIVEEIEVTYGGFASLVSLFSELETASTADGTLVLHAGDVFAGTLYYTFFRGAADAAVMSGVCFDAMTLGNHEFDGGNAELESFIDLLAENSTAVGCPEPPAIISANVVAPAGSTLESQISSSIVKSFGNESVGIIGLTTATTLITSSPDSGTEFTDEVAAVEAAVADLEGQGINKIIVLTHVGYETDTDDIAAIDGVDIVVGGHSHTLLGDEAEVGLLSAVGGSFPTMQGSTCVVTAWEYGHGLGDLLVTFDPDGVVLGCTGSIKLPYDSTEYAAVTSDDSDVELDDTFNTAFTDYLNGLNVFVPTTPDASTLDRLAGFVLPLGEVIAFVPEDICYERIPGQGRSDICTPEETISQGGGVCNLVAKSFLDQAPSSDVAIQNGGGCRTDIVAGNYTTSDAFELLPFANTLVTLTMTGAEIVQVLNEAVSTALFGESTGAYPYASGLRFDVDGTNADAPVSGVEVNVRLSGEWTAIDEEATYVVVTNSFVAAGRDGYDTFGDIEEVEDLFLEYANTFIEYARQEGELLDPPLEEYSTKSFIPKEDPNSGVSSVAAFGMSLTIAVVVALVVM